MTTKQIADYIQKPEQTVKNWVKKASIKLDRVRTKLDQAAQSKKPADYDIDETIAIIEIGMGANAASMYRANAQHNPIVLETIPQDSSIAEAFRAMSRGFEMLTEMVKDQSTRLQRIESQVETRKALLPPVEISPAANVTKLVRQYAERNEIPFANVFRDLYREFLYRYHHDLLTIAKNRKTTGIKVAEVEGWIGDLEALAAHLYGEAV